MYAVTRIQSRAERIIITHLSLPTTGYLVFLQQILIFLKIQPRSAFGKFLSLPSCKRKFRVVLLISGGVLKIYNMYMKLREGDYVHTICLLFIFFTNISFHFTLQFFDFPKGKIHSLFIFPMGIIMGGGMVWETRRRIGLNSNRILLALEKIYLQRFLKEHLLFLYFNKFLLPLFIFSFSFLWRGRISTTYKKRTYMYYIFRYCMYTKACMCMSSSFVILFKIHFVIIFFEFLHLF